MSDSQESPESGCLDVELIALLKAVRDGRIAERDRCLDIIAQGLGGIAVALRRIGGDGNGATSRESCR